ncbi:hypothetical protein C8R44DRAFT_736362 [Mycena epipterygia]|nr:hypothetical protein C8R44DRAFT_736362 [Mycena epipterygia]
MNACISRANGPEQLTTLQKNKWLGLTSAEQPPLRWERDLFHGLRPHKLAALLPECLICLETAGYLRLCRARGEQARDCHRIFDCHPGALAHAGECRMGGVSNEHRAAIDPYASISSCFVTKAFQSTVASARVFGPDSSRTGQPRIKPVKLSAPIHFRCMDEGAEGSSSAGRSNLFGSKYTGPNRRLSETNESLIYNANERNMCMNSIRSNDQIRVMDLAVLQRERSGNRIARLNVAFTAVSENLETNFCFGSHRFLMEC